MTRLVLLVSALLLASHLEAEPRRKNIDHQAPRLIQSAGVVLNTSFIPKESYSSVSKQSPLDQATKLMKTIIDGSSTNGQRAQSQDYGFVVRPWIGGRNGLGVKVELTW